MTKFIATFILLSINLTSCFAGTEILYLACETTVLISNPNTDKSGSKPAIINKKRTISIDSLSGAILEGTIFETRNKGPNFYSKATGARFSGGIKSESEGGIYLPKEVEFLLTYYSLDRFTGKLDAHILMRQFDESRLVFETKLVETGTCKSTGERKF